LILDLYCNFVSSSWVNQIGFILLLSHSCEKDRHLCHRVVHSPFNWKQLFCWRELKSSNFHQAFVVSILLLGSWLYLVQHSILLLDSSLYQVQTLKFRRIQGFTLFCLAWFLFLFDFLFLNLSLINSSLNRFDHQYFTQLTVFEQEIQVKRMKNLFKEILSK
jgi:hypothetical protein